jgi:hypothetical protein
MAYKYTMLFQVTTNPEDLGVANPHTGGWSESFWRNDLIDRTNPILTRLFQARARLLSGRASMVGYRIAQYTLNGNKAYPGSANTGRLQFPGPSTVETDIPQMALDCTGATAGQNTSRFSIRNIPDGIVLQGEYQPTPTYKGFVTQYLNTLVSDQWSMIGRDFDQPSYRVVSVDGGRATFAAGNNFATGDYVRMFRVRDTQGRAISGAFLLEPTTPPSTDFLLQGWPQGRIVTNSGTARRDIINVFRFTLCAASRISIRKVGRPFEQYRGRRSRRRVA